MLQQATKQLVFQTIRRFCTTKPTNLKVTLCGATGGIGQPLSMLLKMNPLITELALYDLVHTLGVAADVSHIDTASEVEAYLELKDLPKALRCSNLVIISAGVPRKPGLTRDDLFKVNAGIIAEMACNIADVCPTALIAIITNPLNSVVPIAAEILKGKGVYDPNRLFGVCTLDTVRSHAFIGSALSIAPQKVKLPVIGGHSGNTIIPVISNCQPEFNGGQEVIEQLTKRIQEAGTEVVKAKAGAGSATLSIAYASSLLANSLLKALKGEKNIVECLYVESKVTEAAYFATPLTLGKNGIEKNLGLPQLNEYEHKLLEIAVPELQKNIKKGVDFVAAL